MDADAALVAATLAGQQDAFATLVERHQRRLFLALRRLTGNDLDAEEIALDGFVRAWENLRQFDPAYPFFPWLSRIAINLWHNRMRRTRREVPLDAGTDGRDDGAPADDWRWASDEPSLDEHAAQDETQRRVWRAVDDLPDIARHIVVMRHALELSYEEISAATGLPLGTVKSRLSRARDTLAAALAGAIDED